jgi:hypothetical protein
MDSGRRRILTTGSVIAIGTILIILDAPPVPLILGTVAMGLLIMVLTGGLHPPTIKVPVKNNEERKAERQPKQIEPKPAKKEEVSRIKSQKGGYIAKIRAFSSTFAGLLRRRPSSEPQPAVQKIDEMLNTLIAESPPVPPIAAKTDNTSPAAQGPPLGLGPMKELTQAHLEDDLLSPALEEGNRGNASETGGGSLANLDLEVTPEISLDADEGSDEVQNILKAHEGELEGLEGMPEMEFTMDSLDGIDLENLDIGKDRKNVPAEIPAKISQPALVSPPVAKNPPPTSLKKSDDEMLAFSQGGTGSDDFMASLKSEVAQVRKPKDLSLLRELKDEKPVGKDLENELLTLSAYLKSMSPPIDKANSVRGRK